MPGARLRQLPPLPATVPLERALGAGGAAAGAGLAGAGVAGAGAAAGAGDGAGW